VEAQFTLLCRIKRWQQSWPKKKWFFAIKKAQIL